MWYSLWFTKALAGDLELVIGVNPHPRHVDVAQFGCNQVLLCVHVRFDVVGNRPRSGPIAHELAVLGPPGYLSHQNIIANRELWQSLAVRPRAVPLKLSHRCINPAVFAPF